MTDQPFSIRSEADVLALVPFTFGFHPEDSLVLITLGADPQPFHARIDLPDDPGDLTFVAEQLVVAALRNGGRRALVIVYSDDSCLAERAAEELEDALDAAGISTILSIRADGARWFPLGVEPTDHRARDGVPYDVQSHQLTSQAVLEGRVTYRDRSGLADSLLPCDPGTVDEVTQAHSALQSLQPQGQEFLLEAMWVMDEVRKRLAGGDPPAPLAIARLLRMLADRDVRDHVWMGITRSNAPCHVTLWREVVRRSPEGLLAPAAGLLAFSSWLAGDGALAWCAVERCLEADPDHTLGQLVAQALEAATPPSVWQPPEPSSVGLFAG